MDQHGFANAKAAAYSRGSVAFRLHPRRAPSLIQQQLDRTDQLLPSVSVGQIGTASARGGWTGAIDGVGVTSLGRLLLTRWAKTSASVGAAGLWA
jgi:hypothetical protein